MAIQLRHLVIRYGVFVLLILMSIGILFFICSFELRIKSPIHLFYDSHDHFWHGYIEHQKDFGIQPQDTLVVIQTSRGDISYIVENITLEPMMIHLRLSPAKRYLFPDTYIEGFIYVGKEKMRDKILNKRLKIE